jgi:hypothetical protein
MRAEKVWVVQLLYLCVAVMFMFFTLNSQSSTVQTTSSSTCYLFLVVMYMLLEQIQFSIFCALKAIAEYQKCMFTSLKQCCQDAYAVLIQICHTYCKGVPDVGPMRTHFGEYACLATQSLHWAGDRWCGGSGRGAPITEVLPPVHARTIFLFQPQQSSWWIKSAAECDTLFLLLWPTNNVIGIHCEKVAQKENEKYVTSQNASCVWVESNVAEDAEYFLSN